MATGMCLLNACAPSRPYMEGQGFYSELFTEAEVEAAGREGKVKNLGEFSIESSACGIYSRGLADDLIIIPALKKRLLLMGGNAAQNVKATERADIVIMAILASPMACGNWAITGEALFVDRPPTTQFPVLR